MPVFMLGERRLKGFAGRHEANGRCGAQTGQLGSRSYALAKTIVHGLLVLMI